MLFRRERGRGVVAGARAVGVVPAGWVAGEDRAGERGPAELPAGSPLAWCFSEGRGRVFSTGLGHVPAAWESRAYLRHLLGGLAWSLGEGT